MKLSHFREVWFVDTEYHAPQGHRPDPICLVAREFYSGRVIRLDRGELLRLTEPPFDTGRGVLFVAFYASAELGVFIQLGWPMPVHMVDLFVEFRNLTNGLRSPGEGSGLLAATRYFGLFVGGVVEKQEMRELAMRGGPFSSSEMRALLDYCESDVRALESLWGAMERGLELSSLVRGDYMKAIAIMEWNGVPIDAPLWNSIKESWDDLKLHYSQLLDPGSLVWKGTSFSYARFEQWLKERRIEWPRLVSGKLDLKRETWKDMARGYDGLRPFAELRNLLSQLRSPDLSVGPDHRNRAMLSAFRSKTGRNQPSTNKFVFGLPSFLRPIITPPPGKALAYIDWERQEFGIGGCLSQDSAMIDAYGASDPYLAFAIQAEAAPVGATKESHKDIRNMFKMVVLGVGYGMSEYGLAARLGISQAKAARLLALHRKCYPAYWKWREAAVDSAQFDGQLTTRYGWSLHVNGPLNFKSLANFPCQANGAEMMRLASIYAAKEGVRICAPVHDAFLIEAPEGDIMHEVSRMKRCMAKASSDVLAGFELKTDAEIIRYPDRFGNPENALWVAARQIANQPLP